MIRPRRYDLRRLGLWAMVFVLSFCAVAAIQVWRVSERLGNYLSQNRADFLFLEHREIKGYPFLARFAAGRTSLEFERLYQGRDAAGNTLERNRFLLDTGGAMAPSRHQR